LPIAWLRPFELWFWPNRDRFVLSNGHASMLLYSMLHLTGVKAVNSQYALRPVHAITTSNPCRARRRA